MTNKNATSETPLSDSVAELVRPIRLGDLTIDFPIFQAALSGYSDRPMRVIAQRFGAGCTIAQVMLDRFIVEVMRGSKAGAYLRVEDGDHPVGAQIMGSNAAEMAEAAVRLADWGFDLIDLNFGCPVKKVVGKFRGGYLLSRPDLALEIVARVRDRLPPKIPLTVKMRRGMDDTAESRDRFFEIYDGAFERGVVAATVHGRTVKQRYDGPSRREFLREVKQHAPERIVLGSGDLFTARDCIDMMRETGIDGVTIARGAIGNPWIFRDVRSLSAGQPLSGMPPLAEQRETLRLHFELSESIYGAHRATVMLRKFGIKYSQLHPHADQVRDAFVHAASAADWYQVLDRWYTETV